MKNKFDGCINIIIVMAVLFGAGIAWLQHTYGAEVVGVVVIALAVLCVMAAGAVFTLAVVQAHGSILVSHEKARSRVSAQEARMHTETIRSEAKQQQQIMRQAHFLGRHIGANYKAQISAQYQGQRPVDDPVDDQEDDRYTIDLDAVDYQRLEPPIQEDDDL